MANSSINYNTVTILTNIYHGKNKKTNSKNSIRRPITSWPYTPTETVMKRQRTMLILTHGYPLFLAMHLYFGDWCRKCQVIFNIVPMIVFGGLFLIWRNTSHVKLNNTEKFYLGYFIFNIVFIYCFYCICIFSSPKWIYDRNYQVGAFIFVTLLFYIFNYRDRKWYFNLITVHLIISRGLNWSIKFVELQEIQGVKNWEWIIKI